MFFSYEVDFLEAALAYSKTIFFRVEKELTNEMEIPEILPFKKDIEWMSPVTGELEMITLYDIEPHTFSKQVGVLKFIEHAVDVEQMASSFLISLNKSLIDFEKEFKDATFNRGIILTTVEYFRSKLIRVLDNWNMKFFQTLKNDIRNEDQVKNILRNYIHSRLDACLLNLRIAKNFFDCYALVKNYDKGFLLLSKAFKQNKWAVDIYVNTYIKYACEKPLMHHFLQPEELYFQDVDKWQWKSVYDWINTLHTLKDRNSYMKSLLDYLKTFLSIEQVMEILETLAINADKTANYYESERYYENFLYVFDNVAKLNLIKEHFSKKVPLKEGELIAPQATESIPRTRALSNLKLNQKYVSINNEIIRVTNKNHNFEKGLAYIANNVFLYYNSIRLINDTDPNKYPKKTYDVVILQKQKDYAKDINENSEFQYILSFFNSEFKKTVALHKDIWVSVNNNFNVVDGKLYEAVKNCLENLQKIPKYNKKNLWDFISGFVKVPNYKKSNWVPSYMMDLYYPYYTGVIEHHEYERWILTKLIFIQKLGNQTNGKKVKTHRYQNPTQSSKIGKDDNLKDDNVTMYYNLKSDPPEIIDLLFTHCLHGGYKAEVPAGKREIVKQFRSRLKIESQRNPFSKYNIWEWMYQEISMPNMQDLKQIFTKFAGNVKRILDIRAEKVERAKNIVKSFVHKFKIDHVNKDAQTENNMLLMFKDSIGRKTDYRRSRFSNEFEINAREFQVRYELFDLQARTCNRLQPISLQRMSSQEWQYLQQEDRCLNDNNTKEYLRWRAVDRFRLVGDLKYHYLYNNEKDQPQLENALKTSMSLDHKRKQIGPEVMIEESVAEINRKTLHFLLSHSESKLLAHSTLNIDGPQLSIGFMIRPTSLLNYSSTKIILNLDLALVDYKEQLLKSSEIKFESCYPIIYHFLAIEYFKSVFIPDVKPEVISRELGVKEIVITTILNSMGRILD